MTGFLLLNRMVGTVKQPISINLQHVVAVHPAFEVDRYSNVKSADGSHVWTTLETGMSENVTAWSVVESYDEISAQVTLLIGWGA